MRTPVTVEQLDVEYVPLDALLRWPSNPKEHDIGAIAQSMMRFGFRDPLGVNRRNSMIEEGHGRLDTLEGLRQQGRAAPRFVRVDENGQWLVPVLYFDDDDLTQHGYSLAHNRTQDLGGGYDDARLRDALEEQARYGLLHGTGYDGDDLHALNQRLQETAGDESAVLRTQFNVLVICGNEQNQLEVLERLTSEGLQCRALTS